MTCRIGRRQVSNVRLSRGSVSVPASNRNVPGRRLPLVGHTVSLCFGGQVIDCLHSRSTSIERHNDSTTFCCDVPCLIRSSCNNEIDSTKRVSVAVLKEFECS